METNNTVILKEKVRSDGNNQFVNFLVVLSALCVVFIAFNIMTSFTSEDSDANIYCFFGAILFAVLALIKRQMGMRDFIVSKDSDNIMSLELIDPDNGNILIKKPFTVRARYKKVYIPKAPDATDLFLIFINGKSEIVLVLKHYIGLNSVPTSYSLLETENIECERIYFCMNLEEVKAVVMKY
jgi:hypothetical protein